MSTGGSIQAVNIAGRAFHVTADADASRKLGGFTNEVQANGDGTARKIMTREPWSIDGLVLDCDNDRGDQEFLQDVADNPEMQVMSVTFADGSISQGTGTIVGDMVYSSAAATAAVNLMGPGKMTRQLN